MRTITPSFILELPLKTSKQEEKELLSRFESARNIYNTILRESKNRAMLVKQSKDFQKAKKINKSDKKNKTTSKSKNSKIKTELFKKARDNYDFNEYSLHKFACITRHSLKNNLDIHTVQKLATRAFRATEKILYGTAKNIRYKSYNQLDSIESKNNEAGIRWRNNKVEWNKLSLEPIIDEKDEVIRYGLKHRVKYSRILRKVINGKNRFYVQLVLEGKPFIKEKNKLGVGKVCFDLGPSTIAIVSLNQENNENKFNAKLLTFCSELDTKQKRVARYQRRIERQRRLNNPQNYLENNKIKKGKSKWKKSNHQLENQKELTELQRTIAAHRKSLQGRLVNETLRMGNSFQTEKISKKWFQKLYGKSVGIRAPAMFTSGLKRKAESAGASYTEFPTQTTKLSQTCVCSRQKKKKLSERVHDCECGVHCQRDLFSAFLGLFVEKLENTGKEEVKYILQTGQAERLWPSVDKLLQTVWRDEVNQSTSRGLCPSSYGRPKANHSQSGSSVERGKKIIAKFKVQDVVFVLPKNYKTEESLKANEVFPLEPTGF